MKISCQVKKDKLFTICLKAFKIFNTYYPAYTSLTFGYAALLVCYMLFFNVSFAATSVQSCVSLT